MTTKNPTPCEPVKREDLLKCVLGMISICVLDIAVHYQYIPSQTLNTTSGDDVDNQTVAYFRLDVCYSQSANILLCLSIFRAILLCLSFKICRNKSIPKLIKPYRHHVAMTTAFVFITFTTWRLLVDSEHPNNIFCFAYMFFVAMDLTFVISEYRLNSYVLNICVPKKVKKSKKKKKKKKRKPGTTSHFFVMFKKVTSFYTSEWLPMASAYGLMIVATTANSLEPFLNSVLIDAINSDTPMNTLPAPVIWFSLNVIVMSVVSSVRRLLTEGVGRRIAFKAKCQMYSNILRQEIGFFDQNKSGKILRRLGYSATSNELEDLWSTVETNIEQVFQLVTQLIVMFGMSWRLTLILLVGNYIIWLPENLLMRFWHKKWTNEDEIETSLSSMSSEAVRNIRTVKSFANEETESKKFKEKLEEYQKLAKKTNNYVEPACLNFERVAWLLIRGIVLFYGGHLIANKQLTSGTLITFLLYMEQLWSTTSYLISLQSRSLISMLFKMERFFDYLERESKIDTKGKEIEERLRGKLEFKQVYFHYPTRPESTVLKDLSFTVGAGEVVALVGSSGGGKSTCVHLLERFYEPVSGSITLDDKPLANYDNEFLHRQISLVSQEPVLFGTSIEENIKYGKPDATHEEVVQAAKDANAHDFILSLADGYETDVGEAGSQMSGGQKQRIAIARALITNPKIMLLDEATSALDAESESLVQEALKNTIQGRTVIIIAHRLSTVEHANKIVVINKGTIAEQGTHDELIAKNGVYCKLVRKQVKNPNSMTIEDLMKDDNEIVEETTESSNAKQETDNDKDKDKEDKEKESEDSDDSTDDSSDDSSESSDDDDDDEEEEDKNKS